MVSAKQNKEEQEKIINRTLNTHEIKRQAEHSREDEAEQEGKEDDIHGRI